MSPTSSSETVLTQAGRVFAKAVAQLFDPESANRYHVAQHSVFIPQLPDGFEGLRVIQLSDLHFYEHTCPEYKQRVIDTVNQLKPDIVVTTGDIIHYGQGFLDLSVYFLSQLQATMGKYSCMGNHDYSDDAYGMAVRSMLADAGFQVLMNEAVAVEKDGQRIWLSGLDDFIKGKPDIDAAFSQVEADQTHVCLVHNPRFTPLLTQEQNAPQVLLAGHTHGGQIDFFLVNFLQRHVFKQPYQYGWFEVDNAQLYVTSGVGSAVVSYHKPEYSFDFALQPFRVGTTPEIAVFDLTSQPLVTPSHRELVESL